MGGMHKKPRYRQAMDGWGLPCESHLLGTQMSRVPATHDTVLYIPPLHQLRRRRNFILARNKQSNHNLHLWQLPTMLGS